MNRNAREGVVFAIGMVVTMTGASVATVNWRRDPILAKEGIALSLMGLSMIAIAYVDGRTERFIVLGCVAMATGVIALLWTLLYGPPPFYRTGFAASVLGLMIVMQALWVRASLPKTLAGKPPIRLVG